MIAGVGIDLVQVSKVGKLIRSHPKRVRRLFTKKELNCASKRGKKLSHETLASIFAGKEAVLKMLGTGWIQGLTWTDVEVTRNHKGSWEAQLRDGAKQIANHLKITKVLVDVSSTKTKAIAHAIGMIGT